MKFAGHAGDIIFGKIMNPLYMLKLNIILLRFETISKLLHVGHVRHVGDFLYVCLLLFLFQDNHACIAVIP